MYDGARRRKGGYISLNRQSCFKLLSRIVMLFDFVCDDSVAVSGGQLTMTCSPNYQGCAMVTVMYNVVSWLCLQPNASSSIYPRSNTRAVHGWRGSA